MCDRLAELSGLPVLMPDLLEGTAQAWRGDTWPPRKAVFERQQGWMNSSGRGGWPAIGGRGGGLVMGVGGRPRLACLWRGAHSCIDARYADAGAAAAGGLHTRRSHHVLYFTYLPYYWYHGHMPDLLPRYLGMSTTGHCPG